VIVENIVHFARVLRTAGLRIGPDRVLAAIAAVQLVGLDNRADVRAALAAVMLDAHEQEVVFDQVFDAFWRDPKLLERLMYMLLPKIGGRADQLQGERNQRVAQALSSPPPPKPPQPEPPKPPQEVQFETLVSFSQSERLQRADFESMTPQEFALAKALAERVPLPVSEVLRRRQMPAARGRIHLRRSLLRMARQPHMLLPAHTTMRREMPPLVVLLDISGSMERYARLFLHYVHGLTRRHLKVQTFTFGTRLTNITRCLRARDPDVAMAMADQQVDDWKGGTRIGTCLQEFNQRWARRVLGANAAVLLVTDGLDRDGEGELSRAAAQLQRLAHEIVWLNPLLRFDGFEPKAAGVRALLPHVDRFLPVHNLASLADLGRALRAPSQRPARLMAGSTLVR